MRASLGIWELSPFFGAGPNLDSTSYKFHRTDYDLVPSCRISRLVGDGLVRSLLQQICRLLLCTAPYLVSWPATVKGVTEVTANDVDSS
jgi:hypothetical protein